MADAPNLLDQPAVQSACTIALGYLDDAVRAAARLDDRSDREALHDFRVAIRRLRVTIRAYPGLHESVPRKHRRRLRKLVRGTNAARDAEVQIVWFNEHSRRFSAAQRSALAPVRARLRGRHRRELARAREMIGRGFARLERKVRRRLGALQAHAGAHEPSFRAVAGAALVQHAAEFTARLQQLSPASDPRELHTTRIAAKRLRYLLEPLEPGLREGASIVEHLKQLQDAFGALTDAHELELTLRDGVDGAAAAMTVLRADVNGSFARLRDASANVGPALTKAIGSAARRLIPVASLPRSMRRPPKRRARAPTV